MPTTTGTLERLGLRDGRRVRLRAVDAADAQALAAFYASLSIETRHFRFFSAWRPAGDDARRLVMPAADAFAVVAETDDPGMRRVVGDARWTGAHEGTAEMAIAVADDYQGAGLGKAMLRRLAHEAGRQGVHTFTATVLGRNDRMRRLLEWWGCAIIGHDGVDSVQVTMATAGGMPDWLPRRSASRRVLVEGRGWLGRADFEELRHYGYHVTQCQGPGADSHRRSCPLLTGSTCRLAAGADAIVLAIPTAEPARSALVCAHAKWHGDVPVVVCRATEARAAVDDALQAID